MHVIEAEACPLWYTMSTRAISAPLNLHWWHLPHLYFQDRRLGWNQLSWPKMFGLHPLHFTIILRCPISGWNIQKYSSPWHHGATIMGTTHQAGGICLAHGHPSMSATQLAPSPGGCKFWPSQLAWKIKSWNRLTPTRTLLHTYNCHHHHHHHLHHLHHHQDHPNHTIYLHEVSKFATPSEQYVGWGNNINFIFMRDQNSQHPMSNMLTGVITSTLSSWGIKIRHPLWTICWLG